MPASRKPPFPSGVPGVPEPSLAPERMAVTVPLPGNGVSLLSTSVSLLSTLPLALAPAVPLRVPPASMAAPVSLLAIGASFAPLIVMVRTAVSISPPMSRTE